MKLKLYLLLLFSHVISSIQALAQEPDSVRFSVENEMIVVRYDFLNGEPDEVYEFYLYSSHDNFQKPLQQTTGDIGKGITVGPGKVIYWNAKAELGNFKGDLSLRIQGDKYVPIVSYQNIYEKTRIKRGSQFEIHWKPGDKSDKVLLSVLRRGVPVLDPLIVDNSGSFVWTLTDNVSPGKGYAVRIADTNNLLRQETSDLFSVKRRTALGFTILPAAIITGGVAALLFIGGDDESSIPLPPSVPGKN